MAYVDFKDSAKRTASEKVLLDPVLILQKTQNTMDMKEILLQRITNLLIKRLLLLLLQAQINLLLKVKIYQTNN